MKWKTLNSKLAFDGSPFFILKEDLVETAEGKQIHPWYKLEDNNFVTVVALKNDNIILVEQYRYGAGQVSLELPSGGIEKKESPLEAAKRELLEETGYSSNSYKKLGQKYFEDPSFKTSSFEIFLATDVQKTAEQNLDETEELSIVEKPLSEAIYLAINGYIISPPSIVGILTAAFHLGKIYYVV